MRALGVVLAAGASRRFGPADKLLAGFHGAPLVRAAASALLGAGCDAAMAVISSPEVAAALPQGVEAASIAPGLPMAASFHRAIGLAVERRAERLLICLGDMPNITPALLGRLLRQTASCACRHGEMRSPPLLLMAADYAAAAASAEGDKGARRFLAGLPAERLIEVEAALLLDIDRPEDAKLAG